MQQNPFIAAAVGILLSFVLDGCAGRIPDPRSGIIHAGAVPSYSYMVNRSTSFLESRPATLIQTEDGELSLQTNTLATLGNSPPLGYDVMTAPVLQIKETLQSFLYPSCQIIFQVEQRQIRKGEPGSR